MKILTWSDVYGDKTWEQVKEEEKAFEEAVQKRAKELGKSPEDVQDEVYEKMFGEEDREYLASKEVVP